MPEITEHDLDYLAGLFDGEGSIVASIIGGKPQTRLTITMTAENIIDWLVATWGGSKRKCSNKSLKKLAYTWDAVDTALVSTLGPILASKLKCKGDQLRLLLELRALRPGRGVVWSEESLAAAEELVVRIQTLNRR